MKSIKPEKNTIGALPMGSGGHPPPKTQVGPQGRAGKAPEQEGPSGPFAPLPLPLFSCIRRKKTLLLTLLASILFVIALCSCMQKENRGEEKEFFFCGRGEASRQGQRNNKHQTSFKPCKRTVCAFAF